MTLSLRIYLLSSWRSTQQLLRKEAVSSRRPLSALLGSQALRLLQIGFSHPPSVWKSTARVIIQIYADFPHENLAAWGLARFKVTRVELGSGLQGAQERRKWRKQSSGTGLLTLHCTRSTHISDLGCIHSLTSGDLQT